MNFTPPRRSDPTVVKLVVCAICRLLAFSIALLVGPGVPAAEKDAAASAPATMKCEVRYHFRERLEGVKPGGKQFSTPSFEKEVLPAAQPKGETRLVEGRVEHLPYRFAIKWTRSDGTDAGMIEVNVLDRAGKSLPGYPQTTKISSAKDPDARSQAYELPISKEVAPTVTKEVLAKNQMLTHVDLVVAWSP